MNYDRNLIENQYLAILAEFPKAITIDNTIYHLKIPIQSKSFIEVDFRNYPKKPKLHLINSTGETFRKMDQAISSLGSWKTKNFPNVVNVIREIFIKLSRKGIVIKNELLQGILALCREHHPEEFLGLLRVENDIVTEFILPPGALTSKTSGVFFPHKIPLDLTLQGTIHSHPTGNPYPSNQDLNGIFKSMRFNFIVGHPYELWNVKCFDRNGKELEFETIL
ncbi:MAG: Mov34/MPN/PAD-1 family protein [Candidatus Lokiarchaeota archaeon]|nr:Mov34/MPN/PAD-1 family protein [Candidatus Lokiarchaeota archaeon]